jgi:hypothetical protein
MLIEIMFNPGNGLDSCLPAWKRHACRMVYFELMSYVRKLIDVRDQLVVNHRVPGTAFNIDSLEERFFRYTFASYFSRHSYVRTDDGDGYPNTLAGELLNYECQPVVVVTRKKSPRYGRCRFVRPVNMDANVLITERNNLLAGVGAEAAHTIETIDGNAPGDANNQVTDLILLRPVGWKEVHEKLKLNNNFSFISVCLRDVAKGTSALAFLFLRGYIKYLADKSNAGRNWDTSTGAGSAVWNAIGSLKIYGDYSYRDLFYRNEPFLFKDHMKNFGRLFEVDFWARSSRMEEIGFFAAWIEALSCNKRKAAYVDVFMKTTNDLDLNRLGQLICFSRIKVDGVCINRHVAPPPEMHVIVTLEKQDPVNAATMDRKIRRCNSRPMWNDCITHCKDYGCLTNLFLSSVMKLRILWCVQYRKLVDLVDNDDLCELTAEEMRQMYYNHSLNVQEVLDTAAV